MKTPTCKECIFFVQHYTLFEHRPHWVNCGHCIREDIRNGKSAIRLPDRKACPEYAFSEEKEPRVVSREYLSKGLLK